MNSIDLKQYRKEKGITIYNKQALFTYKDKDYIYSLKMSEKRKKLETRFDISVNS